MVTLFGEILNNGKKEFLFSVAANLGDANNLGISGHVWLPHKGTYGLQKRTAGPEKGFFSVRLSFELAALVAERCKQARQP